VNVRIWSVAEQELTAAAAWYEEQQSGLGSEFLEQYEAAMTAIERDAASFPVLEALSVDRPIRRCRLKKFPYLIVFEIVPSEAVVYAIVHLSRNSEVLLHRVHELAPVLFCRVPLEFCHRIVLSAYASAMAARSS
jgi:toxin ParE1/3/4